MPITIIIIIIFITTIIHNLQLLEWYVILQHLPTVSPIGSTLMMLVRCHKRVLLVKLSFFSSPAVFRYVVFCRASNWFGRSYKAISSQFISAPQNTHEEAPAIELNVRVCVAHWKMFQTALKRAVYGMIHFIAKLTLRWFLGAVVKFRKVTISFVMSVRPSVRMEQLGFHWMDFQEVWYLLKKIQVSLKSDKNNGHFAQILCIYIPLWIHLRMRNVSDKSCRQN